MILLMMKKEKNRAKPVTIGGAFLFYENYAL